MQKMRTWKRVSAVMLTIAMLVGMLSMLGGLGFTTSAAVSEDLKFKANFSELAAIANAGGVYADATSYRPGYTTDVDKDIMAWVDEKFDLVTGYGNNFTRTYLGQSSSTLGLPNYDNGKKLDKGDTWSGENYWNLSKDGYIQQSTKNSGQVYRLTESFVPKVNGKQVVLSNFEAKLTFSVTAPGGNPHGILVAFHEKTAAFTRNQGDHVFQAGTGSMVLLNNGAGSYTKASGFGMFIYDQNNTYGKDGAVARAPLSAVVSNSKDNTSEGNYNYHANRNIDGELFENNLSGNTKYDLIVRVVGTAVTVTVKDMDGNVMYTKEKTLEKAGEGYFSFGSSNAANRFYAVEIQELDENGLPVAFGTKTGEDELETLKIGFTDLPEAVWASGKVLNVAKTGYFTNPDHDTSDVNATVDMSTDFLNGGRTTYTIDTKDQILVDYLESKFAFYYSQEGKFSFERPNINGYVVNASGVEWTGTADAAANVFTPDTKINTNSTWDATVRSYIDGVGPTGNTGNGIAKWAVADNQWLQYTNNEKNCDGAFRKSGSIAFKDKNGELLQIDNFKLDLDFKMFADGTYDYSNIAIGFHANQPYLERGRKTQALFAISPFGGYFLGDNFDITTGDTSYKIFNKTSGGYDDFTATADKSFTASHGYKNTATGKSAMVWPYVGEKIGHNTEAHLTLTVVGNTATAKVTKGETVILEKTVTLGTYYGSGYLFLSGANQQGWYSDIEVTRLDANGNPVDFSDDNEGWTFGESFDAKATYHSDDSKFWRNTGADMFWMAGGNATYYKFDEPNTYAEDAATVAQLKEKFDFWAYMGNKGKPMTEPYNTTQDALGSVDSYLSGATARWYYTTEGLTHIPTKTGGGEVFRKGLTISPKVNGELVKARNVEVLTDLIMTYDSKSFSAWGISLRSKEAGVFINGNNDGNNKYADHIAIQVRPDGINFVDGVKAPQTSSSIAASANFAKWNDAALHYNVRVYAKVVNNKLTVKVTDSKTGATLYEETDKTVSYVEEGYVALTTAQGWAAVSNLYVNTLDGAGNVINPEDITDITDRYVGSTWDVTYKDMFPYGTAAQAEAGIPTYLQTAGRYINYAPASEFGGQYKNTNYLSFSATGQHFLYKDRDYAVADGYTLVTEGDVTCVKDAEGNVVASTNDYTVDAIGYKDAEQTVIHITSNHAELNTLFDSFMNPAKAYLYARFDAYYVDTDVYKAKDTISNNNWGTELNCIYGNEWLQFTGLANSTTKNSDDPDDKHISLLVPKNPTTGELVKDDEFAMNFRFRLSDAKTFGTTYVVFNMPEAGNIGKASVSDSTIAFNSDLHAIKINSTQFQFWTGTEWIDLIADGGYTGANHTATLSITVADGKLTGSIHFDGKSAQSFEAALTNTHEGYMAIGQNGIGVNFGAMSIDTFEDGNAKIATVNKTEGGKVTVERVNSDVAGMYKYVVTATADEGWQMKANTLLGTDANGQTVYPAQRVGFRTDLKGGDSYYFYTAEDVVFNAEFYTPFDATQANMANLGTSYNVERYGLRFISRIYVTEENGVKYTEIDGKKYEVVDYGMIFAVQAGLDWGAAKYGAEMTLDNANPYISKPSAMQNNVHYDISGNYVDIAATIVGLAGNEDLDILARAYVQVKVGDKLVNAYTNTFSSCFLDNADLNMVTYLDTVNGDDANAGTEDEPMKTFAAAVKKATMGGKIVAVGTVTLPATFGSGVADKEIVLTGDTWEIGNRHSTLNSPVTFENTKIVVPDFENTEVWFAAGHKLVIKDTVTMEGHFDNLYGGVYQTKDLERTDLEIYAGNYHNIIGGSAKKYVAETHITVGGNVNAALRTEAESSHNVGVWGGGVESADTGDTYITFGGNAYSYMIYGGSSQAGTISGDTHVTITGGECAQIFGGCDRVSMTGNTNVVVKAGTVTRRIYGGCYNETNIISWSSSHHVTGNTTVTLYEAVNFTASGDYETGIWATSRYKSQFSDENSLLIYENEAAKSKFSRYIDSAFCNSYKNYKVGLN